MISEPTSGRIDEWQQSLWGSIFYSVNVLSQILVIVAVPPSDSVKCTRPARGKNGRSVSSIAIVVLVHDSSRRLT